MSATGRQVLRADVAGFLALACMTAMAYFGGLQPMMQARQARATLLAQIEMQQAEGLELGATIAMLRRQRDALLIDLDRSARRLHPITKQNERLAAITALASETGLIVDEVHPEQAQFGPRYGKMPVRIHARGEYGECTMFLHRLADYPDLGVQSLRLLGSPSDADQTPVLIVELVWYVLPPERRS